MTKRKPAKKRAESRPVEVLIKDVNVTMGPTMEAAETVRSLAIAAAENARAIGSIAAALKPCTGIAISINREDAD